MKTLVASLRVILVTQLFCVGAYVLAVWGFSRAVVPESASGSPVRNPQGVVVGSRLIAQNFTQARYIWPRPSAVDYRADASGGSNLSPTSDALRERAAKTAELYRASAAAPLPADLAAASGSGLDPHISLQAALYQANRVAAARGVSEAQVIETIQTQAATRGENLGAREIVNVLQLNLALDAIKTHSP